MNQKMVEFWRNEKRFNVAYGGRDSSKSWAIAQIIVTKAYQEKHLILCTRRIQKNIKDSVHSLIKGTIHRMRLQSAFEITRDEIRCKTSGSVFIFKGLDTNIEEIKSTEGITLVWIEEAAKIKVEAWKDLIPTIRKTGSKFYIVFNPDEETDPVYQRFIVNKKDNVNTVFINYYDNKFISEEGLGNMEDDRDDPDLFNNVWLGKCKTISDAVIFKGKFTMKEFEAEKGTHFYFGADFRFNPDPITLNRIFIKDKCLYIDYETRGVNVDIDDMPAKYDTIPEVRKYTIRADSSRNDTISYLKKQGFLIRKSKNSAKYTKIEESIDFVKSFKMIYIHPRCQYTYEEFSNYKHVTDKVTGENTRKIEDKNNHHIDNIRYALEGVWKSQQKKSNWSTNDLGI